MPSTQNETLLRLVRDHGGKVAVASKAGTSRNTLDRALKGEPVHKSSLRKIASALGVTVEHLSSDADKPTGSSSEGRTPQRVWWTTSPTARLNLQMVARRYGVEPTTIFESAPILFAIAAEQSLRERRERLADIGEGLHALILDDLGERVPGLRHGVYRSETALGVEEASIRARDIDFRNEDADEPGNGRSPFVEFLADRIREFDLGEVEDSDEETTDTFVRYRNLFEHEVEAIHTGDPRAAFALREKPGLVRAIPKDLEWTDGEAPERTAQRRDWLAAQLADEVWEEHRTRFVDLNLEDL